MFSQSVFYLCNDGEIRKRANQYRSAYRRLNKDLFDFVHSMGAEQASVDTTMMKLRGIVFRKGAPAGWTKPDKHGLSRPLPIKGNATALEKFTPSGGFMVAFHQELADFHRWLNCPISYHYKSKNCEGWTRIGHGFNPVALSWYCRNGPILLKVPDMAAARREAAKEGQTIVGDTLSWKPPKGCKKMLIEEWELMAAKYERRAGKGSP